MHVFVLCCGCGGTDAEMLWGRVVPRQGTRFFSSQYSFFVLLTRSFNNTVDLKFTLCRLSFFKKARIVAIVLPKCQNSDHVTHQTSMETCAAQQPYGFCFWINRFRTRALSNDQIKSSVRLSGACFHRQTELLQPGEKFVKPP